MNFLAERGCDVLIMSKSAQESWLWSWNVGSEKSVAKWYVSLEGEANVTYPSELSIHPRPSFGHGLPDKAASGGFGILKRAPALSPTLRHYSTIRDTFA